MAFLDALGKKLTQTGQEVVQKTKDTAEVIKYNSMISEEERRINELYVQIGKTYVDLHSDSCELPFTEMISGIKDAQAKIAEYREHIVQVKGVFTCPNCGEELPLNVAFCSACGTKIEKQEPVAQNPNTRYCQGCGAPMQDGYVFCINCGAKYEEPAEEPVEAVATEEVPTVEVAEENTSGADAIIEEVIAEEKISE